MIKVKVSITNETTNEKQQIVKYLPNEDLLAEGVRKQAIDKVLDLAVAELKQKLML